MTAIEEHFRQYTKSPILLSPRQFTPLARTPWAGEEISRKIKDEIAPNAKGTRIGESWEFSCDPDFPSLINGTSHTIIGLIKACPEEVLSPELAAKSGGSAEILVKLLNASEPLSLQVHPADGDAALLPNECGKPESWLVLDAQPGSGIYLGFSESISREKLREALLDGDRCKKYLQFVTVKTGDFFDLAAGVPHAIGPGVTILEPQRILFGRSGKTYRLWDWGRKYDIRGHLDMQQGKPRELHIEQGLRLIDPMRQVGVDFVNSIRRQPVIHDFGGGSFAARYPDNGYYALDVVTAKAGTKMKLNVPQGYGIVIPLMGAFNLASEWEKSVARVIKGQPVLLPHAALPVRLDYEKDTKFALIVPTGVKPLYG
jgi:mannose-6-phosphate isomerase